MEQVGLSLHPAKTKIVFCRDDNRRGTFEFTAFTPASSPEALKAISREVRGWRIHAPARHTLDDLAGQINPVVRGWMNYYGRFYRSLLHPLLKRINGYLVRWARKKYRRLASFKRVKKWWDGLVARDPRPFQDHDVSPRMVNGRSMERPAHRVASVTSMRPAMRSAPIARLRRAAMTLGPDRVLTWDLSS